MGESVPAASDRQLWLVPSEGQQRRGLVADVAVEARVWKTRAFAIPTEMTDKLRPGSFVRVPFGRKAGLRQGVCVAVAERNWDHTHTPVADVLAELAPLSPRLVELGLWIGEFYVHPPGPTLASLIPAPVQRVRFKTLKLVRRATIAEDEILTAKQASVIGALRDAPRAIDEVLADADCGRSVLTTLAKRGLVELVEQRVPVDETPAEDDAQEAPHCREDDFALTPGQAAALDSVSTALSQDELFRVFLLFGVPGSGKTEVYVRAIRRALSRGKQAILLVPEIALATQIVQRISRRFARVAILHGRLTDRARRETMQAIAAGRVDVVIGTRSAIFAPCERLGVIVVDEEQDSSYKNLAAPYFHARDVAIKRAQLEQIPCMLGSATPALETWHNAHTLKHFELLRLPDRVADATLPKARLVRSDRFGEEERGGILTPDLQTCLRETLDAGHQAILLHNRRGYAVFLRCKKCGMIVTCPRCATRMVFHQLDRTVRCHRCGQRGPAPQSCPDETCGGVVARVGQAIQRLEEELQRDFPKARLLRLDRDTMRHRDDYSEALARFEAGAADVLIGTQMVAKGLDFPRVRLVGVIDADGALTLPDFRAGEQVFQLIMQVVGRAGRQEGASLAIVQADNVGAPAVRTAVKMDFEAFARDELGTRRRYRYPPFSRLARLVLADARPGRARAEAAKLAPVLRELAPTIHPKLRVGDASACAATRLREMFRFEVIVRGPRDATVQHLLREALQQRKLSPRVQRFSIDVDPVDLL